MPWPPDLTTKTVTSSYPNAGAGLNGYVSFVLTADVADATAPAILRAAPVQAEVVGGVMTPIVLPCTDNTDLSPSGWAWTATEVLKGAPTRIWSFYLPHTLPSTVDLADLTPLVTPPTLVQFLLAANNLSDLTNVPAARTALGLGSAALASAASFAQGLNVTTVQAAPYAMTAGDYARFDVSAGSVSQPLPQAPANGTRIGAKLIKTNATLSNTLTLTCQGTDVLNVAGGSTSLALTLPNQGTLLQYTAGSPGVWTVQSDDLPLGSVKNLFPDWLNAKAYGAVGNGRQITDAAMTATSNVLTSTAQAQFTAADIGKIVVVMGAGAVNGAIGTPLPATITGYTSATQVTLSAAAVTTVANATANYGTDDLAHSQAALNACQPGQTAFFPAGIYMHSGELSVTQVMRITGDGATICTTNSAGVNFHDTYLTSASASSTTAGLEIDHLVFDCAGGHVFYNLNWNRANLHDLRLVQRSYNFGVISATTVGSNQLDLYFSNITSRVYGAPRTVPAWQIISSVGGGTAMGTAQNCLWQQNDHDTSQYFVWIECTGTSTSGHGYANCLTFDNCWGDSAYGGFVKLLSVQSAAFRSCNIVDSAGGAWGGQGYYIGASTGGSQWASQKISFQDCGRDLQGPNGTSSWDIFLESTCDSVLIENYLCRDIPGTSVFFPQFNLGGATNVVQINNTGAVVTNPPSSGVTLGPNGNISYTGTLSGAAFPDTTLPGDLGYQAWTYPPEQANGTGTLATGGTVYLGALYVRGSLTINNLYFMLTAAATAATAGENFIGIYSSAGVLLGSVEVTSSLGTINKPIKAALSAPINLSAGFYWIGMVFNAATTEPTLARSLNTNIGAVNGSLLTAALRYTSNGTLDTALPASITPANNSTTIAIPFWAAAG